MPKIRGIKPEFWTDEKVVEVGPYARLLFVGMWNFACDNGHLEDRPKQIKLRILPADAQDADALIEELRIAQLCVRKDGWIIIPTLRDHQKPDKRYFLTCDFPGCSDAKPVVRTRQEAPPEHDEYPPDPLDAHDVRTWGPHGGHVVATTSPSTEGEGDGDGDGDGDSSCASADAAAARDDRFDEFWSTYDKKRDRKKAEQKWRLAIKKRGVTADMLIQSAAVYVANQRANGKHPEFTKDPTTWLNGECWNDETPTAPAYAPSPADDDWEEPEEDRAMYEAYDAQMRALEEANR